MGHSLNKTVKSNKIMKNKHDMRKIPQDALKDEEYFLLMEKKSRKLSLGIVALLIIISAAFILLMFNVFLRLG